MSVYHSRDSSYAQRWEVTSLVSEGLARLLGGSVCLWNLQDDTGKERAWLGGREAGCKGAAPGQPACAACLALLSESDSPTAKGLVPAACAHPGAYLLRCGPLAEAETLCIGLYLPQHLTPEQLEGASSQLLPMVVQDLRLRAVRNRWAWASDQLDLVSDLIGKLGETVRATAGPRQAATSMGQCLISSVTENTGFAAACVALEPETGGAKPFTICRRNAALHECPLHGDLPMGKWLAPADFPDACAARMRKDGLASAYLMPLVPPGRERMGALAAFARDEFTGSKISDWDVEAVEIMSAVGAGMLAAAFYQQARESNEMKYLMLFRVTHDLRTPLAGIKGFAESLLDPSFGPLTDLQRDYGERIHRHARRVYQLAEQLLRVERAEKGVKGPAPEFVQASEVATRLWDEERYLAAQRDLGFRVDAGEEECPTWAVLVDLESILRNLMGNAVKYTLAGGQITVAVRSRPGEGTWLTVSDTGRGIAEDDLEHIFEPFYRSEETGGVAGFGYGLTLVKRLVDLHHGTIDVKSEVGKGSVFTVWLPPAPSTQANGGGEE